MRLLGHDEILPTVAEVYDRAARRPGVIARPTWMWQRYLEKALELGGDAEFVAVHTSADGVDDGFVHYHVKWVEERSTPSRGTGEVYDLWGVTPAVELALWDYLCNVDLVDEWYAEERPVDDVIQFAVADTRAYRTKWIFDEQWLRLLDVDAALTARRFADVDGAVTIGVSDPAAGTEHRGLERVRRRSQAPRRRRRPRPRRRHRSAVGGLPRRHAVALARRRRPRRRTQSGGGCRSPTTCSPSPRRRTAAATSRVSGIPAKHRRLAIGSADAVASPPPTFPRTTVATSARIREVTMTLTVCWSAKGGSGTTVVAAALALGSTIDSLLVDLDGELPAALGVPEPSGQGLSDWFASDAPERAVLDLAVKVAADDPPRAPWAGSGPPGVGALGGAAHLPRLLTARRDRRRRLRGTAGRPARRAERAGCSSLDRATWRCHAPAGCGDPTAWSSSRSRAEA